MSDLLDELSGFKGPKQHYLVHRIAGFSRDSTCVLLNMESNLVRVWKQRDPSFKDWEENVDLHRLTYQEQALKLLRKANFFTAVQLEKQVLEKLLAEVISGELVLAKTMLARVVYSSAMEAIPSEDKKLPATWEQLILTQGGNQIATATKLTLKAGITEGKAIPAHTETEIIPQSECSEGEDDQIGEEGYSVGEGDDDGQMQQAEEIECLAPQTAST